MICYTKATEYKGIQNFQMYCCSCSLRKINLKNTRNEEEFGSSAAKGQTMIKTLHPLEPDEPTKDVHYPQYPEWTPMT